MFYQFLNGSWGRPWKVSIVWTLFATLKWGGGGEEERGLGKFGRTLLTNGKTIQMFHKGVKNCFKIAFIDTICGCPLSYRYFKGENCVTAQFLKTPNTKMVKHAWRSYPHVIHAWSLNYYVTTFKKSSCTIQF